VHELGLTQSIVDLALEYAAREDADRIVSVAVEIGSISGVIPEAVEFAFDVCRKGTIAEGARLEINHIPGRADCLECKQQVEIDAPTHVCPHCGGLSLKIIQGQEMKFTEMEVE
jgi:hydrogenase nickel incorporation protein HypA/HybF